MINAAQGAPCAASGSLGSASAASMAAASSPWPWPLGATDFPFTSFIIFIFHYSVFVFVGERVSSGCIASRGFRRLQCEPHWFLHI